MPLKGDGRTKCVCTRERAVGKRTGTRITIRGGKKRGKGGVIQVLWLFARAVKRGKMRKKINLVEREDPQHRHFW